MLPWIRIAVPDWVLISMDRRLSDEAGSAALERVQARPDVRAEGITEGTKGPPERSWMKPPSEPEAASSSR